MTPAEALRRYTVAEIEEYAALNEVDPPGDVRVEIALANLTEAVIAAAGVDTSGYEEMRVPHVALARERLAPPLDPELEARALKAAVEQIRRNWRIVEEAHVRSR